MFEVTYVLPIKWSSELDRAELTRYLEMIAGMVSEVIVVDGSPADEFNAGSGAWGWLAKHLAPDSDVIGLNGKVSGVITGVRAAGSEKVVIADDDVRYEVGSLARIVDELEGADLVIPQNHFVGKLPWHALIDTSRTLINRAFGADFPGTMGVRRSTFLAMGGYDGDVMFENLELIRTVTRHGGRVTAPLDLYVARVPPTTDRYFSQRVRQAYDDLALPGRMVVWLAVLPVAGYLTARRRSLATGIPLATIAAAEVGRRKGGGRKIFPAWASLLAPVWLLERGICSWLALVQWLRGGVRYGDKRIKKAANR